MQPQAQTRARQSPPPDQVTEHAALAALVVLLLSGASLAAVTASATAVLAPLGITGLAVSESLRLLYAHVGTPEVLPPGSARAHVARTEWARRAAYVLNAGKRLTQATVTGDPEALAKGVTAERRYLEQHLSAARSRREAAARVDATAHVLGTATLGWKAVMDSRTTPDCARLHRTNFEVAHPPLGILPGTLHGGTCRCVAAAPWPGQPMATEVLLHSAEK